MRSSLERRPPFLRLLPLLLRKHHPPSPILRLKQTPSNRVRQAQYPCTNCRTISPILPLSPTLRNFLNEVP